MRTCVMILMVICLQVNSWSQELKPNVADTVKKTKSPEVLTSGFFDVISNGQINASARFLKIYVGEPGKFYIPLSIYSGVSANSFETSQAARKTNDQLVNNFINPVTGIANVSIDHVKYFHQKDSQLTKTGYLYQAGERILSGYKTGASTEPSTGRPVNFLNSYIVGGFYFQTGAWDRNDLKNIGIFWMTVRYIVCFSSPGELKPILPGIVTSGIYHGYSIGWGIDINKLVNLKVIYYRYLKAPEMDHGSPIYQFTFHYYMKAKD